MFLRVFQLYKGMTLNLRKLVSVSSQLAFEGCRVIHESLTTKSYKAYLKGVDDHVTDVDVI